MIILTLINKLTVILCTLSMRTVPRKNPKGIYLWVEMLPAFSIKFPRVYYKIIGANEWPLLIRHTFCSFAAEKQKMLYPKSENFANSNQFSKSKGFAFSDRYLQ